MEMKNRIVKSLIRIVVGARLVGWLVGSRRWFVGLLDVLLKLVFIKTAQKSTLLTRLRMILDALQSSPSYVTSNESLNIT